MTRFETVLAMLAANPILGAALAITFLLMGAQAWHVHRALHESAHEPELRR